VPEPATVVERVEKKGLDRRNINISYCVQTYNRDGNKLEIPRDTCVNKDNVRVCIRVCAYIYIYIYIYIYMRAAYLINFSKCRILRQALSISVLYKNGEKSNKFF